MPGPQDQHRDCVETSAARLLVGLMRTVAGPLLLGVRKRAVIGRLTLERAGRSRLGCLRLGRPALHLLSMLSRTLGVFGCLLHRFVLL